MAWPAQIEHGEVTSIQVIACCVQAGGTLDLVGDVGDRTVPLPVGDPRVRRMTAAT